MAEEDDKKKKRGPPFQVLANKQIIPLIAFGTYKLEEDEKVATDLLRKALQIGFGKHIDAARLYGNETLVGKIIKTVIEENRVKRSELFIASKIYNDKHVSVVAEVKEILQLMQLKYLDLLYMHWPAIDLSGEKEFNHKPLEEIWAEMQLCVAKGYVKHLGISNFNGQALMELLTIAKIKPVALQIQVHPYLSNNSLVQLAQKNGLIVFAHTPLVRGDNLNKGNDINILKDETINEVASKHGKTPAQVVLKSTLYRGIGVITKTNNVNRVQQNFESWTVDLGEDDMKKIRLLNKNYRVCDSLSFMQNLPIFD